VFSRLRGRAADHVDRILRSHFENVFKMVSTPPPRKSCRILNAVLSLYLFLNIKWHGSILAQNLLMNRRAVRVAALLCLSSAYVGLAFSGASTDRSAMDDCACEIYIPNAFSPNEDGANDTFSVFPSTDCQFATFTLQVFDRWGNKVFETQDQEQSWDGMRQQEKVAAGAYIYVLQYSLEETMAINPEVETGILNLIR